MSYINIKTHTQFKYCQKYNTKISYRDVFRLEDQNLMKDIKNDIFTEHTFNHLMRGKCLPHPGPTFDAYIEENFPSGEFSFEQLCHSMFPDDSPEPKAEYESVRDYLINGRNMTEGSADLMLNNQYLLLIEDEYELANQDLVITLSIGEEYGDELPTLNIRGDQIRSTGYLCDRLNHFGYLVRQYYAVDRDHVRNIQLTADGKFDVVVAFTRFVIIKGTPTEVVCAVTGRQWYGGLFEYDNQVYSSLFCEPLFDSIKQYLIKSGVGKHNIERQLLNQALLTIKEANPDNKEIVFSFTYPHSSIMEEYTLTAEQISYMGTAEWTLYGEDDYKIKYYKAGNSGISLNYITETHNTTTGKLVSSTEQTLAFDILVVKTKEVNIRGVLCEVVVDVTGFNHDDYLYKSCIKAYGDPVDEETYQLKTDIENWIEAQKEKKPLENRIYSSDDLPF